MVIFSILLVFYAIWFIIIDKLLYKSSFITNSSDQLSDSFDTIANGNLFLSFIVIVIVGPIVEELLFRGILFRYFERLSSCKWVPILGTAIVYYQTKDIKYSIMVHIFNNLIVTLSEIIYTKRHPIAFIKTCFY